MYFYLSFLRPPPVHATAVSSAATTGISLTPQIANDLRTELFTGTQDIYYNWSPGASSVAKVENRFSRPLKLTTWRGAESAYKEIRVPFPPGLRGGQTWRLILSSSSTGSHAIDLCGAGPASAPLGVASMPIMFGNSAKEEKGKQEQIERVYDLGGQVGALIVRENTSFDLDKKIWDSGIGLSSWICETYHRRIKPTGDQNTSQTTADIDISNLLFSGERCNIIELGAGTGIVALVIAALRSSLDTELLDPGCIITTDLPTALPLLEHNISANCELYPSAAFRPKARILDWEDQLSKDITDVTGGFHLIILADVTYNTASFPALVRTLACLIRISTTPPAILLGYKERDPAERTLWDMALAQVGIIFEQVSERAGAGGKLLRCGLGKLPRCQA